MKPETHKVPDDWCREMEALTETVSEVDILCNVWNLSSGCSNRGCKRSHACITDGEKQRWTD